MAGETPTDLDFSTGDRSKFSGLEAAVPSYQFVIENTIERISGKHAGRLRQRSTDIWSGNNTIRALLNRLDTAETAGQEYWYFIPVYIPNLNSDGEANVIGGNLLWEKHHPASLYNLASLGVAPYAIHIESNGLGNYKAQFRIATGNGIVGSGWTHWEPNIDIPGLNPMPIGQWVDFLVHIVYTEANAGTVEVWADPSGSANFTGAPVISRTNIPTLPFCNSAGIHNVSLYTELGLYTGGTNLAGGSDPTDIIHGGEYRRLTKADAVAVAAGTSGGLSSGTGGRTTVGSLQVDYGSSFISLRKIDTVPAGKTREYSNPRAYQRGGINVAGSGNVKAIICKVPAGGLVADAVVVDVGTSKAFVATVGGVGASPAAGLQSYSFSTTVDIAGGSTGTDVYFGFINQGTGGAAQNYYDHGAANTESYRAETRYSTLAPGDVIGALSGTSDADYTWAVDWVETTPLAVSKDLVASYIIHTPFTYPLTGPEEVNRKFKVVVTAHNAFGGISAPTSSAAVGPVPYTGNRVRVKVTATNATGSQGAISAPVGPVDGTFSVAKSLTTSYFVRRSATKTITPSYTVKISVTKTVSASYTVRAAVTKNLISSYSTRASVTKILGASYYVIVDGVRGLLGFYVSPPLAQIAKNLVSTYTIKVTVAKTLSSNYVVHKSIVKTVTPTYTVRGGITKSLSSNYVITGGILKTVISTYFVRNTTVKTLSASYTVKKPITKTVAPSYTVVAQIKKQLTASYNVIETGTVQKLLTASYNVRVTAAKSLSASYTIRATVSTKVLTSNYIIRAAVVKDLTASYSLNNVLVNSLTTSYTVHKSITKNLNVTWGIGGTIQKNLLSTYTVRQTINKDLHSVFSIVNLVVQSFVANYTIVGRVKTDLTVIYVVNAVPPDISQLGFLHMETVPTAYLYMEQFMTDIGDTEVLRVTIRDRDGNLITPTLSNGWVYEKDVNVLIPITFSEVEPGVLEAAFNITNSGKHIWRYEGSGNIKVAGERHFTVKKQEVVHA